MFYLSKLEIMRFNCNVQILLLVWEWVAQQAQTKIRKFKGREE